MSWPGWRGAALAPLSPLFGYQSRVDACFALALLRPIAWAFARRRVGVHAGLLACAGAMLVLSMFMPQRIAGTAWMDKRLPAMAVLLLAAAVRPWPTASRRFEVAALALGLAVPLARDVWVAGVWIRSQPDAAAVERVLAHVPPGVAVLPVEHRPALDDIRRAPIGRYALRGHPMYWHLAALATLERRAFVPYLFTAPGKQPLRVRPPWDEIAVPEGIPPAVDALRRPDATRSDSHLAHWRDRFDFVLVLNADLPNERGPLPPDAALRLVADEGFAALYQVVKHRSP